MFSPCICLMALLLLFSPCLTAMHGNFYICACQIFCVHYRNRYMCSSSPYTAFKLLCSLLHNTHMLHFGLQLFGHVLRTCCIAGWCRLLGECQEQTQQTSSIMASTSTPGRSMLPAFTSSGWSSPCRRRSRPTRAVMTPLHRTLISRQSLLLQLHREGSRSVLLPVSL